MLLVLRDDTKRKELEERLAQTNTYMIAEIERRIKELQGIDALKGRLFEEAKDIEARVRRKGTLNRLIGNSEQICKIKNNIEDIAASDATVLITGEIGTGKDLIAGLIHELGTRKDKPFVEVNCSAISESLLENELFGHERGAFTGAASQRKGKFEQADGGTLFLDEIGDISPKMQAALLRTLETGEIQRLGSERTLKTDVRVVTATNVDLSQAVRAGNFRQDLFFRLNVLTIHLPALRERREDIITLATHFIKLYRNRLNKPIDFLPGNVRDKLLQHDWPGNIRELKNVLLRAMIMAKGHVLAPEDIHFEECTTMGKGGHGVSGGIGDILEEAVLNRSLKENLQQVEKEIIRTALTACKGDVKALAGRLGISKSLTYEKLKQHNLHARSFKSV